MYVRDRLVISIYIETLNMSLIFCSAARSFGLKMVVLQMLPAIRVPVSSAT